jgi:hypothetical protein
MVRIDPEFDSPAKKKESEAKNPDAKVITKEMDRTRSSPIVSSIKVILTKQMIRMIQTQLLYN